MHCSSEEKQMSLQKPRVYLSHSPADEPIAMRLAQDLIEQGIAVWAGAASYGDRVAWHECQWFVVLQTPDAVAAPAVRAEVAQALAAIARGEMRDGIRLQLASGDGAALPPGWNALHSIDASGQTYAEMVAYLAQVLWERARDATTIPGERTGTASWPGQQRSSRRRFLISAGLAGAALATGAGALLARRLLANLTITTTLAAGTPTAVPSPGTLLFTYQGHRARVYSVAWSPNGKRIASGAAGDVNGDTTVQLWDAASGGHVRIYYGHAGAVRQIAWAHSGRYIASCAEDHTAQVWDPITRVLLEDYHGHTSDVECLDWSPHDDRIATGSLDTTVQIWQPLTGKPFLAQPANTARVNGVAWSPDGTRLAICGYDGTAKIWDARSGTLLLTYTEHTGHVYRIRWSPDGRWLATSGQDSTVRVWNPTTGADLIVYTGHKGEVYPLAWSPDGQHIASGGEDHTVRVWEPLTGHTRVVYRGHAGWVDDLAWSPDGTRIASGSDDHTVQVWQAR
jgi:hypothetical protein